jgi:hypothetical protein
MTLPCRSARHVELAALWSQGDSLALYGEAELAGAVDHFNRVRLRLTSEGKSPELVMHLMSQLHEKIGENCSRVMLSDGKPARSREVWSRTWQ